MSVFVLMFVSALLVAAITVAVVWRVASRGAFGTLLDAILSAAEPDWLRRGRPAAARMLGRTRGRTARIIAFPTRRFGRRRGPR